MLKLYGKIQVNYSNIVVNKRISIYIYTLWIENT